MLQTITKTTPARCRRGFTIVELMVATMVFGVILLVITAGVISFTKAFYRGVNASATQNVTRSIIDTLSQAIQFNGGNPSQNTVSSTTGVICAGTTQEFDYRLGVQLVAGGNALYRKSVSTCPPSPLAISFSGGNELLQPRMRLSNIRVNQVAGTPNLYYISVTVAFGDNDLLCAPTSSPGSCDTGAATLSNAALAVSDVRCKLITGAQFCGVSTLSTNVEKRVK